MSCDATVVCIVYAEKANPNDPSCGCYHWGHYGPDGKPCHHETVCAAHQLIRALAQKESA